MGNFLIAKATDVGMQRQVNEDSITVFESPNGQVMAVCDGMGGQAAGDVASQLAVSIIESILTDNTFDSPDDAIKRSVLAANQGLDWSEVEQVLAERNEKIGNLKQFHTVDKNT